MTPTEVFLELVRGIEDQRWGDLPRLTPRTPASLIRWILHAVILVMEGRRDVPLSPLPKRKAVKSADL